MKAICLEGGQIPLGCRLVPHLAVHRRSEQHRGSTSVNSGKQRTQCIVGPALSERPDHVHRARRNQHRIEFFGKPDVLGIGKIVLVPHARENGTTRKCLKGHWRDEPARGLGHRNRDLGSTLNER